MLRCLTLGGAKSSTDASSSVKAAASTPLQTKDGDNPSPSTNAPQPEATANLPVDNSDVSPGIKISTNNSMGIEASTPHSSGLLSASSLSPAIGESPPPLSVEESPDELEETGDITALDIVPELEEPATESQPITISKRGQHKPAESYAIRLTPCVDHSLALPFHYTPPVERRTSSNTVIRVGRLNSNDTTSNSETPIVFKSKVVSRTHAELQCIDGEWFIRDLQSSSGTFLNNVRLSQPNKASPLSKLNNGDTLQLGLNFRGGSEEVFQAVKVRIELNYSWHRQISEYNVETLRKLKSQMLGTEEKGLQECTICLENLKPRQPLFLAPCSHGWHYACIRPLLVKFYPHFSCPNCRDVFNLEDNASDSEN